MRSVVRTVVTLLLYQRVFLGRTNVTRCPQSTARCMVQKVGSQASTKTTCAMRLVP